MLHYLAISVPSVDKVSTFTRVEYPEEKEDWKDDRQEELVKTSDPRIFVDSSLGLQNTLLSFRSQCTFFLT